MEQPSDPCSHSGDGTCMGGADPLEVRFTDFCKVSSSPQSLLFPINLLNLFAEKFQLYFLLGFVMFSLSHSVSRHMDASIPLIGLIGFKSFSSDK